MVMKKLIRRILQEETYGQRKQDFIDRRNIRLKNFIETYGLLSAIKITGSRKNFLSLHDLNSPIEFLNLFSDYNQVEEKDENILVYKNKYGIPLFVYDNKNKNIYFLGREVKNMLDLLQYYAKGDRQNFKLNKDSEEFIKDWINQTFNLDAKYINKSFFDFIDIDNDSEMKKFDSWVSATQNAEEENKN
jgi:hypothetical protein